MLQLLFVAVALLGLSFLIFIHELGHYWMAKRVGMQVDVFSIGFGKPLFSWEMWGTKWQICALLFGGYVKIAGMEGEGGEDPYSVKDGYYSKPPIDRIKVLLMGPLVNIFFAFLVFSALFFMGGRQKSFMEVTSKIGWVDTSSELYQKGVRPGDEVVSYDSVPFSGFKDHLFAPMTAQGKVSVVVRKKDPESTAPKEIELSILPYEHPQVETADVQTLGILKSASYLIYDRMQDGEENPLPKDFPIAKSGLTYGDRIVWVDGRVIFSLQQLEEVLNDNKVLLTIQRGDELLLRRTPRVLLDELKMPPEVKEEWVDWQFAANLSDKKKRALFAIPYNLTNDSIVENRLPFIDSEAESKAFPNILFSEIDAPLQEGDRIVAIGGEPVQLGYQLLSRLQDPPVLIIVQSLEQQRDKEVLSDDADAYFDQNLDIEKIQSIVMTIGADQSLKKAGSYRLLEPVKPMMRQELLLLNDDQATYSNYLRENKKRFQEIEDPEVRRQKMDAFIKQENRLILGIPNVQDFKVIDNPGPVSELSRLFDEISRTIYALFTGALHPKWMSGPVGIVHVVQERTSAGFKEALYWLGFISLNLGILNLLPIPVLDGGNIVIALFEVFTGRRLKPKTLERIIIPFAILLLLLFVYLTYNDLFRILGKL